MEKLIKIYNAQLITAHRIISQATIILKGNRIDWIGQQEMEVPAGTLEIDAQGNYVSAGFIDIHVHGGGGADFMDGDVESFLQVAKSHARYGTTSLNPTTLTSEKSGLFQTLDNYKEALQRPNPGANLLGMHLEGPYFAVSQAGAQDPKYIRDPDPLEYKEVIEKHGNSIARWSAAPERPGALEFGKYLIDHDVLAALAHTDAIYEEVIEAVECGYSLATHLYSGMSGVCRRNAYRYAGVIESAFLIDEMDVEIIADGIHLPAPLLKLIYKIKGPDRIALITDAMRGAGMPEGKSVLGNKDSGLEVIIENGVAKLPDRTAFAGSVATTNRLVKNMVELAGVPLVEAVRMQTLTPARIMGVDSKKGSLMAGKDADLVVFDENFDILFTIVSGEIVFQKS